MKLFCAIVVCVVIQFLSTGPAHAQFTANSQTVTISGVSSNWVGFGGYVVGSNTFGDVLLIQNGGVLSNFDGIIGDLSAASNNTAIVTDSGSVWTNYEGLAIGASGAGNNLVISNGGIVWVGPAAITLGASAASSSNNTVTVTGTGSALTNNSDLYVGYLGKGNRMTISGGGAVHDNTGYVGDSASSSNVVTITGPGSVWTHDGVGRTGGGLMVFGQSSTGNQMTTTNGGAVYSSNIIIGNASASSSNVVTITGTGSVWSVSPGQGAGDLEVGLGGPANQLTISDGAAAHTTFGILGGTSKNNVVSVTGTGSVWDSMTDLYVGSGGDTNTLTIGPGGSVVATNVYINYLAGAVANRINIEGGSLVSTNVAVGNLTCPASAQLTVDSGMLLVTNAAHNAAVEVLSGTLTLNGGTAIVDRLVITNACARFVHAGVR